LQVVEYIDQVGGGDGQGGGVGVEVIKFDDAVVDAVTEDSA
jgi:hypothetical protein